MTVDYGTTAGTESAARKIPLQIEVACVLIFAYVPLLIFALPLWDSNNLQTTDLKGDFVQLIAMTFNVVPPLLFVMAVSNEPWSKFGINRPSWFSDFFLAVGLWVAASCAMSFTLQVLPPSDQPQAAVISESVVAYQESGESMGWGMLLLCIVALIANSFTEEMTMRGYLIPRFEQMFRSSIVAVCLSSMLSASYHMYQGVHNMVAVLAFGLVYGTCFCIFRRLWPLVIAHTISNLIIYLNI